MDILQEFHGPNWGHVLALYEKYQKDPNAVDERTRAYLAHLAPLLAQNGDQTAVEDAAKTSGGFSQEYLDKTVAVVRLAQAIREYGHLGAHSDPLVEDPVGDPSLTLATYGLKPEDLRRMPASVIGGPIVERTINAWEAIQELRAVYCSTLGYDFEHIFDPAERDWLREAVESRRFCTTQKPINQKALLEVMTKVEGFEHFLHRVFPGKTRFSIEGLDSMVPILEEIIHGAAKEGIGSILMGMAHRGRLNVMAHVLHKPYQQILAEFKDPMASNYTLRDELGWTGDVKYHLGVKRRVSGNDQKEMQVTIAPNPSHLEHVNPVVEGMVRALDTFVDQPGPARFDHVISMPLLIHGDSAFAGQGIVTETLNMANISGYRTGGTIHIIANNQLGFTTSAMGARSTLYASDPAKGYRIPIVHVNADDPEAAIEAARIAFAFRTKFHRDFLIDLIGYRRYGHNEGDEPRFTQPEMYKKIDQHQTVRLLYARRLIDAGIISSELPEALFAEQMTRLQREYEALAPDESLALPELAVPPAGAAQKAKTAVDAERLRQINRQLMVLPNSFSPNPKIARLMKKRKKAMTEIDEKVIDWGFAEQLAFATILAEGTAIRLTGEDAERGTFSHRHAVIHDMKNGETYLPLQSFADAKAAFEVRNSPLSENAAVGFEYGYNIQAPDRLTIWEGQYGDFVNGAQAVIDEFLVSGRAKWGQTPSLVMLLPHGHEGQGPDHSTGRLERFLQLAAETNMRIANCTTAAQYFHLLRRQASLLVTDPLPLIVMAPKSLLRHPVAASSLSELENGRWYPVIDDVKRRQAPEKVRRVVLCSGKVFVDLMQHPLWESGAETAIVRVEQLYPFPHKQIEQLLGRYFNMESLYWLQEEPQNMGAWDSVAPRLQKQIGSRWELKYIGRPRRSSPAEGSPTWHHAYQKKIVAAAFNAPLE